MLQVESVNSAILIWSRSWFSRPASALSWRGLCCSPTQPANRRLSPRGGLRTAVSSASLGSEFSGATARLNQANAPATPVRSMKEGPTGRLVGMPSSSRRIIGPSKVAFTRASTAMLFSAMLSLSNFETRLIVASKGSSLAKTSISLLSVARPGSALMVLSTRRRLCVSNVAAASTTAWRAAIVDLQVMSSGTLKQICEIDQPGR